MDPRAHNPQPQELWWLLFSVVLGSIVLGVFLPYFLIIAGAGTIAIPVLAMRERRTIDNAQRSIDELQERIEHNAQTHTLVRGVINAADIPMIATNANGVVMIANPRASAVLGIRSAMIGRRFDELFTQRVLHELESLARAGEQGHARASIPILGEVRDFDISADPVPESNGAVLTFRDITELSRAMTLKADFAANASHELRTPIASIKGATETLMGPAKDDPRMSARLIEMVSSNATRLELLAQDLLDLSKLEAEDLPVDVHELALHELIQSVFAEFTPSAQRRELRLESKIDPEIISVRSDPSLLKLMLRNLVSNAIKFAHEGSAVRVIATIAQVPADRTAPPPEMLNHAHAGLEIEVRDKGIGIPLEHQQRVFERFYQVDEARSGTAAKRGTGLGLAIVKHAARRLGGNVSLESVYQSGTTFTIGLPRCVITSAPAKDDE
jgi:two-component system phosphate regulon sensor histidine kinase PhoR